MGKEKKTYPTQSSLIGKKVYLKPATVEETIQFEKWHLDSDPERLNWKPQLFKSKYELTNQFKKNESSFFEQSFSVFRKDDNMLLGMVSFSDYNPLNRSAKIDAIIDPQDRQNGFGGDALKTLIKYLFVYRDLNKVYGYASELNTEAMAMFELLHFKQDGALRDHHFYKGEFKKLNIFSLIRFQAEL